MKKRNITRYHIVKYCSLICGAGILAFGLYNVHSRCDVSEGGVLGLSLLLYHWLGISPGLSTFLMDLAAIAAGTVVLKNSFLFDSIFAAACYFLWYSVFERFDYVLPNLAAYPLAAAFVGGIFVGVGTALMVRYGCGAGADDSLALIFQAKTGKSLTIFYVMSDLTVLCLSLSYIPFKRIFWSLVTVMVSSAVISLLCKIKSNEAPA